MRPEGDYLQIDCRICTKISQQPAQVCIIGARRCNYRDFSSQENSSRKCILLVFGRGRTTLAYEVPSVIVAAYLTRVVTVGVCSFGENGAFQRTPPLDAGN